MLKLSDILISAELVIEEKIDYNDLVDSVEDGKSSSLDNGNNLLVGGNKEDSKAGNFLKMIACACLFLSALSPMISFMFDVISFYD